MGGVERLRQLSAEANEGVTDASIAEVYRSLDALLNVVEAARDVVITFGAYGYLNDPERPECDKLEAALSALDSPRPDAREEEAR